MFYVIFFAVIAFAIYVILHDRGEGEGKSRKTTSRIEYRPEQPGPVPQTPVSQTPKPQAPVSPAPESQTPVSPAPRPLEPAPVIKPVAPRPAVPVTPTVQHRNIAERPLSWTYLNTLEYDDNLSCDMLETEITGMRYYCSLADLGPVNGIVKPEPENPHDPQAHVVLRSDGKKLGYIPRSALDDYKVFNEDDLVCPFAGRVKITHQGYIWADILVALPESLDFVKEELTEYVNSANFGD